MYANLSVYIFDFRVLLNTKVDPIKINLNSIIHPHIFTNEYQNY